MTNIQEYALLWNARVIKCILLDSLQICDKFHTISEIKKDNEIKGNKVNLGNIFSLITCFTNNNFYFLLQIRKATKNNYIKNSS